MTQLFPSVRKGPYSDPIFSPNRSSNFIFRNPPTFTMYALLTDPAPFNLPYSTSALIQWTGPQSFSPTTPSGLTSAIDVGASPPPLTIGTFSDWCAPLLTLGRLPDHIFETRWKPGIMASSTIFPLPFSRLNSILILRKYYNYFPLWPRRPSSLRCLTPQQIQYSIVYGLFSKRTLKVPGSKHFFLGLGASKSPRWSYAGVGAPGFSLLSFPHFHRSRPGMDDVGH